MLFQTLEFFSFFIIFFFLYNFSSLRIQNVLLLLAGCFFYSTWSLKTLPILLFSIFFNFYGAVYLRSLERTTYKKHLLTFLIFLNLFFLILFKYFIFFYYCKRYNSYIWTRYKPTLKFAAIITCGNIFLYLS